MTLANAFPDVVERFAAVVARHPDAIALSDAGGTLTYAALNQEAERLAQHLGSAMTIGNRRVGICLPRSRASVVATLATIKAGGVYVPLDPALPDARVATIIEDADPVVTLVADDFPAPRRGVLGRAMTVAGLAGAQRTRSGAPSVAYRPADACILYTSGTTGKPKGVVIPQRGIVRLVMPQPYLSVSAGDRVLHHSNLSFDASTFEIWTPLLNGATLVAHAAGAFDLEAFARVVRDERITVVLVTTGLFHLIADLMPSCFRGVRVVLTGGESLYAGPVRRVLSACPATSVVNGYGPTENTVYTTCHVIEPGMAVRDPIPIGKPIVGTEIRIAPDGDGLADEARVGQLLVSGVGLSPGYFNNDTLTAQAFVSGDPADRHKRFYRTGDIVRIGDDGNLYFGGRVDNQIKLRGFRIELEEVESCINGLAGVAGSALTLHGNQAANRYLVAHVKLAPGAGTTLASIKEALEGSLPGYMVPSVLVSVEALPLTPNGKVDRARLAAMYEAGGSLAGADTGAAAVPAGLDCILDSWRKHLDAPDLSWRDNVFERGASSLTIVGVQIEVDRVLDCAVPITDLVTAYTPLDWADVYASQLQNHSQSLSSR